MSLISLQKVLLLLVCDIAVDICVHTFDIVGTYHTFLSAATLFGWMNLMARGMGGFFSDVANHKWGLQGRLIVQSVLLAMEGIFVIVFSQTRTLAAAIVVMLFFSFFVQASEGSTYGKLQSIPPTIGYYL
jgi:MFS transporter, NNP family, nitrate/nitrite transporter